MSQKKIPFAGKTSPDEKYLGRHRVTSLEIQIVTIGGAGVGRVPLSAAWANVQRSTFNAQRSNFRMFLP
jgi:hypothetical protein